MSSSSTNLDLIQTSQAGKEITANAFFDAASPATLYGRRAAGCSGLVFALYGGMVWIDGPTSIANVSLTLTASQANVYIEAKREDGSVTQNNTGWTPGRIPLYQAATDASTVTSYTDCRLQGMPSCPLATVTVSGTSGAFQYDAALAKIVVIAGSPTGDFTIQVATTPWIYTVLNTTAHAATLGTGSGSTVTIAAGKTAQVLTDGTQVVRVTADI